MCVELLLHVHLAVVRCVTSHVVVLIHLVHRLIQQGVRCLHLRATNISRCAVKPGRVGARPTQGQLRLLAELDVGVQLAQLHDVLGQDVAGCFVWTVFKPLARR